MNLEAIYVEYIPHSNIENDEVANAIVWGIRTLKCLLNKEPVKTLEEVLSFIEDVLNKNN